MQSSVRGFEPRNGRGRKSRGDEHKECKSGTATGKGPLLYLYFIPNFSILSILLYGYRLVLRGCLSIDLIVDQDDGGGGGSLGRL